MSSSSNLKGWFLECCDCYTICPCWVNERPDEDHCSAIYVWKFDEGSKISGHDIGGKSVVVAAFHGNRNGTQSAIYVDDTLDKTAQQELISAFSGRPDPEVEPKTKLMIAGKERTDPVLKGLQDLSRLVGKVVDRDAATIVITRKQDCSSTQDMQQNWDWQVTVKVGGTRLAHAIGSSAYMKDMAGNDRARPLTLQDTGLHDELHLDQAVEVQAVDRFEMAVAPLPGGPFTYVGRSGMVARFNYNKDRGV